MRGLRYNNAQWYLYVSDPDPMAVLRFKLLAQAIEEAAREIQRNPADRDLKPLTPHDGSASETRRRVSCSCSTALVVLSS
ncbi:MAG: hypothetical protein WCQ21_02660 [Verrucomicrobiota bacterium]